MVKKIDPVDWDKWEDHVSEAERWDEHDEYDPNKFRQDYDRAQGHWRVELLVPIKVVIRAVKAIFKFFGKKK